MTTFTAQQVNDVATAFKRQHGTDAINIVINLITDPRTSDASKQFWHAVASNIANS